MLILSRSIFMKVNKIVCWLIGINRRVMRPRLTIGLTLLISFFLFIFYNVHLSEQPLIEIFDAKNTGQAQNEIFDKKRIALFVQGFNLHDKLIWDEIFQCIENVGKAKVLSDNFTLYPWVDVQPHEPFKFDVYITHTSDTDFHSIKSKLEAVGTEQVFGQLIEDNKGFDMKQFLHQLELAEITQNSHGGRYDSFLKIHSNIDVSRRRAILESLCGTPGVILTTLRALSDKEGDVGVVAPQGFVYQRSRDNGAIFGPWRSTIHEPEKVFEGNLENMKILYRKMYGKDLDEDADFLFSAGTMFWYRYRNFPVNDWLSILPWLSTRWSDEYRPDYLLEHAMERLLTAIPNQNVTVAEIGPAVKPIGIYFPQYHEMPENNAIHGKGFTEWTLLKPSTAEDIIKPLYEDEGGLGYYDLTNVDIRRKQGEMAKAAGVHGFMYYHYWFAGETKIKYTNPVMGKIPELMLEDGHPDLPFMFCWANHPWTNTWTGLNDDDVQLPQDYGGEKEWEKHFYYLLSFFKHHKYIMVDDKPVFVIFRLGDMKEVVGPMLDLWRNLAIQNGLKGLYVIHALNNFITIDKLFETESPTKFCDASFQFFPNLKAPFRNVTKSTSQFDVPTPTNERQYWGGFTTFYNTVRRATGYTKLMVSPSEFRADLKSSFQQMLTALPYTEKQANCPNLFFITAWNEWNEQATMEPSDKYGFSYLSALKENVENQPILKVRLS